MPERSDSEPQSIVDPGSANRPESEGVVRRNDATQVRPGDPGNAAYPVSEAEYWRDAYVREPYYESGRTFEDYSTAYELGWVSFHVYGGEFEPAECVLANDWPVRKGVSALTWEEARPAARAAWQRAENLRSYVSDGSASADQVLATLRELHESACDGELGFREATQHSGHAGLTALVERLALSCRDAAASWQAQIQERGGTVDDGGTMGGAAHRVWLQIRGMFGGASDATLLRECERGLEALMDSYRRALQCNLPHELHAMVQRHFEDAQRLRDHIGRMRERAPAENPSSTELTA